ncbi:hypothetical protein HG530_000958 [Fusarium avenaceum]|nr:hypothetical protein HG530_000958 [Fusarium avenaceum]
MADSHNDSTALQNSCLPGKLVTSALSWLTAICPAALVLLVPAHAGTKRDLDTRRHRETEAPGNLGKIQLVDIKDTAQRVALVQVVVLADELLELRLNVDDLVGGEVELDDGDTSGLEMRQEADLIGLKEHKRSTLAIVTSGGSTNTVNVVTRVIRRIELDNPVNRRNLSRVSKYFLRKSKRNTYIKTTSGDISADQGALLSVTELEEGVGSLLLLLLAVEVKNRKIDGTRAQRDAGKILDLGCLGGGEKHSLSILLGKNLDNLSHFILETDLKNSVRLINNKGLQVLEDEWGVLQMIEKSPRGSDKQVNTLGELIGLSATVCASNDNTVGLGVVGHELSGNTKDLKSQFASWGDDNDTSAVARLKSQSAEHLNDRNQESQSLSRPCLCSTENVATSQRRRDTSPLDLSHLGEVHLLDGLHGLIREVKLVERLRLSTSDRR